LDKNILRSPHHLPTTFGDNKTIMSKHSFIITFDTQTKKWIWDTDQEAERLGGNTIEWADGIWGNSDTSEEINEVDTTASGVVSAMLGLANNFLSMEVIESE
jgi:hypothetical protein